MKHFIDMDANSNTAGVVDSHSFVFESGVVLLNIPAILILNISANWSFELFRLLFESSGNVPAVNAMEQALHVILPGGVVGSSETFKASFGVLEHISFWSWSTHL
jgi:hypothetical protein